MAELLHAAEAKVENSGGDNIAEVKAFISSDGTEGSFNLGDIDAGDDVIANAAFLFFPEDATRYKLSDIRLCDGPPDYPVRFACEKT